MTPDAPVFRRGVKLAAAVPAQRFVTAAGAAPAANGRALGVTYVAGGIGDRVAVTTLGVAAVAASAAIAVGDRLATTADGKAAEAPNAQAVTVATALTAAANADDVIQVHLVPN